MIKNRMKFFAVQVRTLKEDTYIKRISDCLNFRRDKQEFFFPKRKLSIRRMGKTVQEEKPVFPGYIFVSAETIDSELFNIMRGTKGFTRFLKNNNDIQSIEGRDLTILRHFLQFGGIADTSMVRFDENDRIIVQSGPMQGLEGLIVKVDKRKKRAKVALDFAQERFLIDLSFNVLEESRSEPQ